VSVDHRGLTGTSAWNWLLKYAGIEDESTLNVNDTIL